ncbi:MAG: protein translocase subunit SecD [Nitrococcus sp.]|nr:protein translocase subunit SecD [Nitrococcus sp.]
MTNRYPLWKYLIIAVVLVAGFLYALPNLYGEDPALQITTEEGVAPAEPVQQRILDLLDAQGIAVKGSGVRNNHFMVRFHNTEVQLKAADQVALALGQQYTVALNLAPTTPEWLRAINAQPMYLGLDLRGGVHFLMEVDTQAAVRQAMERYVSAFRTQLREAGIRYSAVTLNDLSVQIAFSEVPVREEAVQLLRNEYPELTFNSDVRNGKYLLTALLPESEAQEIADLAVQQNITTLRNRVNELGVAEPVIQRQGKNHIVVELPGVQDTARAKDILGTTATLEFHLVNMSYFPNRGGADQPVPPDSRVYPKRDGGYVVLKRDTILTGKFITDAQAGFDQQTGGPEVTIRLNGAGGKIMNDFTSEHVKDFMGVVFIENQTQTRTVDGETKRIRSRSEEVINVAQIQEPLGSRFRITGLDSSHAAHNLALLLRAGSLAAPITIVEERTIGPSLGQQNIEQGFIAAVVSFLVVALFLAAYYRVFGLFADAALLANLVFTIAILSLLQATLTLPGIAGIALSIAMAVDANVLIYERIREELRAGASPQAAIAAGYERAFSAIFDGNITVLMAAVLLFLFGTGPIKGFAVTLSIGVAASMFTAIMGTRALANLVYGGRRGVRLQI